MGNGNFKVRCVDLLGHNKDCYTVGKIYEIKNGQLTTNRGTKLPTPGVDNFEEWQSFTSSKFKLVEIESRSIHIYPNSKNRNETIAILKDGKEVIKTSKSSYNPKDAKRGLPYDFNIGATYAIKRLLNIEETQSDSKEKIEIPAPFKKASVGDTIKIVDDSRRHRPEVKLGQELEVTHVRDGYVETSTGNGFDDYAKEYIIIKSAQPVPYKEVKRQAEVGEYVKTLVDDVEYSRYEKGEVLKCDRIPTFSVWSGKGIVYTTKEGSKDCVIQNEKYVVLEGYQPSVKPSINLSTISTEELLAELSRRLSK